MKKQIGIWLLALVAMASRADLTNLTVTASPNAVIPDANPVGLISTANVSGMSGTIADLSIDLNITGGFNGDLYAYLLSPDNYMVVLLNRVGMGSSNPFGYSTSGFNITLEAAGYNIHNYASYSPAYSGGQLTGTWSPDRRIIDPQSLPGAFDAAPTGDNLSTYFGADPNGAWKLFVADLSGGSQSTLVSWGLTVVTVPEPRSWVLVGTGLAGLIWAGLRRRK